MVLKLLTSFLDNASEIMCSLNVGNSENQSSESCLITGYVHYSNLLSSLCSYSSSDFVQSCSDSCCKFFLIRIGGKTLY